MNNIQTKTYPTPMGIVIISIFALIVMFTMISELKKYTYGYDEVECNSSEKC